MITQQDIERMKEACQAAKHSNEKVKVACLFEMKRASREPLFSVNINQKIGRGVIHAEENLIDKHFMNIPEIYKKAFSDTANVTMYVTKTPCLDCVNLIIKANIKRLVCAPPYEINPSTGKPSKWFQTQQEGLALLKEKGITVDFIEIEMINGFPSVKDKTK